MRNIFRQIIFISIILFIPIKTLSQNSHEISFWLGGGLSSLKNQTNANITDKKNGIGGTFGIGYTYFFTSGFGIQTGLEYSIYNSKMKVPDMSESYLTWDNEFKNAEMRYSYNVENVEEKQHAGYLQIPLMANYRIKVSDNSMFYISAGGKVGFPVKKTYKHSVGEITTEGYYPSLDVTINDIPEQGFGTYQSLSSKGDMDLKTSWLLSAETGMNWKLTESLSLYTGVYVDYGLNDVSKNYNNKLLIAYNRSNPGQPISHNLSDASYLDGNSYQPYIKKITPFAFGFKVRLGLSL